jgi:hypothetical protein
VDRAALPRAGSNLRQMFCSLPPVRLIAQSAETLFCNIDVLSETVLRLSIEIVAGSAKSTLSENRCMGFGGRDFLINRAFRPTTTSQLDIHYGAHMYSSASVLLVPTDVVASILGASS